VLEKQKRSDKADSRVDAMLEENDDILKQIHRYKPREPMAQYSTRRKEQKKEKFLPIVFPNIPKRCHFTTIHLQ
jgi:hypothetical protein